jgi:hypothetical protein
MNHQQESDRELDHEEQKLLDREDEKEQKRLDREEERFQGAMEKRSKLTVKTLLIPLHAYNEKGQKIRL